MMSVLITSGAMTALLDRLTSLGYIERVVDEKDRRIKRAQLTQKGIDTIDLAIEKRFEEAKNSIKALSKAEKNSLTVLLKKLLGSINQAPID